MLTVQTIQVLKVTKGSTVCVSLDPVERVLLSMSGARARSSLAVAFVTTFSSLDNDCFDIGLTVDMTKGLRSPSMVVQLRNLARKACKED